MVSAVHFNNLTFLTVETEFFEVGINFIFLLRNREYFTERV